ncbi:maleylpyruvate isomerase family mycothiol-dependent enzyme [Saccharothrix violaceirubra]|uniref:Uncharacterized protein (TIGR03083 family) n=1 Tax=Saccharothrix violaceirubra TaxID=413306 RepID=A0A7W7T7Z9_9PSEU|nr:maleylpyruvate isomerase family mycothiol-dependent enzyme [Saccharothrix violaceirubra]MBB4966960.1 uncharacterized protein (TIGR03083 family) [Saccharothrix violaceirubra]
MTPFGYEDRCAEIVRQTDLLTAAVSGADAGTPVPTCPGWTLGRLLGHVGSAHRWAEEVVRTRADRRVPGADADEGDAAWLVDGAARLARTLRTSGPDVPVWTPGPPPHRTSFWARRMMHETALHRYDATVAVGGDYALAHVVAADAVDEWIGFSRSAHSRSRSPALAALRDGVIRLEDTEEPVEWLVQTGRRPDASVTVRGTTTDLALALYGRPADLDFVGDAALFHEWQDASAFWIRL